MYVGRFRNTCRTHDSLADAEHVTARKVFKPNIRYHYNTTIVFVISRVFDVRVLCSRVLS